MRHLVLRGSGIRGSPPAVVGGAGRSDGSEDVSMGWGQFANVILAAFSLFSLYPFQTLLRHYCCGLPRHLLLTHTLPSLCPYPCCSLDGILLLTVPILLAGGSPLLHGAVLALPAKKTAPSHIPFLLWHIQCLPHILIICTACSPTRLGTGPIQLCVPSHAQHSALHIASSLPVSAEWMEKVICDWEWLYDLLSGSIFVLNVLKGGMG